VGFKEARSKSDGTLTVRGVAFYDKNLHTAAPSIRSLFTGSHVHSPGPRKETGVRSRD
jgi:hypothetical protein